MAILTLNAGSSSLKFSLLDSTDYRLLADGTVDAATDRAVRRIVGDLSSRDPRLSLELVVHRIVHGGTRFTQPVLVTDGVRAALGELTPLAPLHNPPGLEVIDAARGVLPESPHVAVFDTAFHATLGPEAFTLPLPRDWTERWSLRRFGFHGLSHAYSAGRAAEMIGRPAAGLRVVIAHLGNGASVTAVRDGRSVETSMGFTPLDGLMMGTRSGSVDPGLLIYLELDRGVPAARLNHVLNHEAGLLAVSGVSSDMREVLAASHRGDGRAALAVRIFAHRARQAIGAHAVTLGGVDALVFTGGIGEHSGEVRQAICDGLACLGLALDHDANASAQSDAIISSGASPGTVLVVTAREDLMMAKEAMRTLRGLRP